MIGEKVFFVIEMAGFQPQVVERKVLRKQGIFYLLDGRANATTNHIAASEVRDSAEDAVLLYMRRKYNSIQDTKKAIELSIDSYNKLKIWAAKYKKNIDTNA